MEAIVFVTANSITDDAVKRCTKLINASCSYAEIRVGTAVIPGAAIFIKEWREEIYSILKQNFKSVYVFSERSGVEVSKYTITGDRLELERLYNFYKKVQKHGIWLHYAVTFHKDTLIVQEIFHTMDENWARLMGDFLRKAGYKATLSKNKILI